MLQMITSFTNFCRKCTLLVLYNVSQPWHVYQSTCIYRMLYTAITCQVLPDVLSTFSMESPGRDVSLGLVNNEGHQVAEFCRDLFMLSGARSNGDFSSCY